MNSLRLNRSYLSSCARFGIPHDSAVELARIFFEERGRYPKSYGEAIREVCK